jgi:hypothetical protein
MAFVRAKIMKIGDLVLAQTFIDGQVERRVVEKEGDTVYICTEEEWLLARKDNREPLCAGFNKRYIAPVTARSV